MNVQRAAGVVILVAFGIGDLWAQENIHARVMDAMFTNAIRPGEQVRR